MSDHSELKKAAEAATPGRIHDRLDSCGGGLKYACVGDDGSLVLKVDHKNDEWGFVGDNRAADEEFFLSCTPSVVLGLIAENEALRKDAERWRFVRNPVGNSSPFAIWSEKTNLFLGNHADEAIDAAMSKGDKL